MKTIYLLGVVGEEITAEALKKELPKKSTEKTRIILDSVGGGVAEGIRVHNLIKSYKGKVEIVLGAMVASSAAYIAMAVPKENRKAFENSSMMIHEASAGIRGRARDFKTIYDRLSGVNQIMADSFALDMGKTRDEALSLMSEDFYMTGWEQLTENNLISEIISPSDVEFPEPTEEEPSWDLFFMQLENKQEENIVKEKMYQAEEKALEDWEKNNDEMGKMVALLNLEKSEHKPEIKPENNISEVTMDLKEFLKANPEAQADVDTLLEAKAKDVKAESEIANPEEIVNTERARIVDILTVAGTELTEECKAALGTGVDAGEYAKAELAAQKGKRADKPANVFDKIGAKQLPGEQDPKGAAEANANAEFDEAKMKENVKNVFKQIGGEE